MKLQTAVQYTIIYLFVLLGSVTAQSNSPVTQRKIHMAGLQVLSGPAAGQYRGISLGLEAYFSYLNDQGGIHGRRVDYRTLDTRMEGLRVEKLIKNSIFQHPILAVVGSVGEPVLNAYPNWFPSVSYTHLTLPTT